jgi:hypothetical protein
VTAFPLEGNNFHEGVVKNKNVGELEKKLGQALPPHLRSSRTVDFETGRCVLISRRPLDSEAYITATIGSAGSAMTSMISYDLSSTVSLPRFPPSCLVRRQT